MPDRYTFGYLDASTPAGGDSPQVGDLWVDLSGGVAVMKCTSISPVTWVSAEITTHDLGGSQHNADTLANLNTKVSDATLDDSGDPRDPNNHASNHTDGTDDVADAVGDSGAGGTHGLVPAPGAGDTAAGKVLGAGATWIDHGSIGGLGDDDHTQYRLESADHSHQSSGAEAGKLDHGAALNGLTDNDHTQYALRSILTTLGDILYAGASAVWSRLAGNTTTTRKFLRQTGDGANSAAPAWDTLQAADIPDISSTYAVAAKGVTNGDSHDHSGGDGAQIDHGSIAGLTDDDHTQYQKESEKGANNGYCGLDASGLVGPTDLPAATDSAQGASELATAAETTTGTDAGRAVTPDGLAGSDYGKRTIIIKLIDDATALATGDGKFYFELPDFLAGWNLVEVKAYVSTVSSSGTPTYQIHNLTAAADILSTALTIDATENSSRTAATPAVINTSEDDVTAGDVYRIDKDVAGTGEKGDTITMVFQKP
uniref:Tail protein n=1 Tax=viral metagenome TaxID=1070528 RepID=A0A6M3L260_9ZZZZ